jgi:hypothetical protein
MSNANGSGWIATRLVRLLLDVCAPVGRLLLRFVPSESVHRWFGSDIFERYTTEYTWYANQFGHFALGLVAATLAAWIGRLFSQHGWWIIAACIVAALLALYIGKEAADWLMVKQMKSPFAIDFDEAIKDSGADIYFVCFGAVFGLLAAGHWLAALGILNADGPLIANVVGDVLPFAIGFGIAWWLRNRYVPGKIHFDKSDLPFYYRLPSYRGSLVLRGQPSTEDNERAAVGVIEGAARDDERPRHLIIYGPRHSGRTAMAVGIAVSLTLRLRKIRYLTMARLTHNLPSELRPGSFKDPTHWPVKEVSHVIIDDATTLLDAPAEAPPIEPAIPSADGQGRADAFVASRLNAVQEFLQTRKTIWVLANYERPEAWRAALAHFLEVPDDEASIPIVVLTRSLANLPVHRAVADRMTQ